MSGLWKDTRMPTDAEKKNLSRLMYLAFVDIRALLLNGDPQQAKDLSDAFHNIPLLMYTSDFSFEAFRIFLEGYQEKYHGTARVDYLLEWEKLNTAAQ
jgi:hypothetical protein